MNTNKQTEDLEKTLCKVRSSEKKERNEGPTKPANLWKSKNTNSLTGCFLLLHG